MGKKKTLYSITKSNMTLTTSVLSLTSDRDQDFKRNNEGKINGVL